MSPFIFSLVGGGILVIFIILAISRGRIFHFKGTNLSIWEYYLHYPVPEPIALIMGGPGSPGYRWESRTVRCALCHARHSNQLGFSTWVIPDASQDSTQYRIGPGHPCWSEYTQSHPVRDGVIFLGSQHTEEIRQLALSALLGCTSNHNHDQRGVL